MGSGSAHSVIAERRASVARGRPLLAQFLFDAGAGDAPTRLRAGSHRDAARRPARADDARLALRVPVADDAMTMRVAAARAFVRAVLTGTPASGGPAMMVTAPPGLAMIVSSADDGVGPLPSLLLAVLPLPDVLVSALVVGLPVTILLKRLGAESLATCIAIGGMAGVALPAFLVTLEGTGGDPVLLAVLGGFSGATTGRSRWRHARRHRCRG